MYKEKRILGLIPARGGSKGIKEKNIVDLCGKPLIAYTIQAAKDAACFDDIIVSTDSKKIADVSREYCANTPFLRPSEIAGDNSKAEDVLKHALLYMDSLGKNYDVVVYLQPTSPLRNGRHIIESLNLFIDNDLPSLVSVTAVSEHPLFMRTINKNGLLTKIIDQPSNIRRQDLFPYYILNGAIYINRPEDIIKKIPINDNIYGFIMDQNSSIDINNIDDLKKAKEFIVTET